MIRILVTGGTGYIGSHTCIKLIKAGYELVVVDNLCNPSLKSLKRERSGEFSLDYKILTIFL